MLLDLHRPFGYTNPSGHHNSGAFKGSLYAHVGMSKLNFPDVTEAEYSSVLGPFSRGEVAARAFAFLSNTQWAFARVY
jgi:hypothetical protein